MVSKVQLMADNAFVPASPTLTFSDCNTAESLFRQTLALDVHRGVLVLKEKASPFHVNDPFLEMVSGRSDSQQHQGTGDRDLLETLLKLVVALPIAEQLSMDLIGRFGGFGNIIAAPIKDLSEIVGLESPALKLIKLVQKAAVSAAYAGVKDRPVLNNWDKLMEYLALAMAYESVEQVRVLFLDSRNHLIADEVLARGTVNHVNFYPREVVKRCLFHDAVAILLVHNHPTGDPFPSRNDIIITGELVAALATLTIQLHDHVIIGKGGWFSFKQRDLLSSR
jgi:DNA repair protein RadC